MKRSLVILLSSLMLVGCGIDEFESTETSERADIEYNESPFVSITEDLSGTIKVSDKGHSYYSYNTDSFVVYVLSSNIYGSIRVPAISSEGTYMRYDVETKTVSNIKP